MFFDPRAGPWPRPAERWRCPEGPSLESKLDNPPNWPLPVVENWGAGLEKLGNRQVAWIGGLGIWLWVKHRCPKWLATVNGNVDQNLRSSFPGGLILTHTHMSVTTLYVTATSLALNRSQDSPHKPFCHRTSHVCLQHGRLGKNRGRALGKC